MGLWLTGIFHRSEKSLQLARTIIDESIAVAAGAGIVLRHDKVWIRSYLSAAVQMGN